MRSITEQFFKNASHLADAPCWKYWSEGKWITSSWQQVADKVKALSYGLTRQGLKKGDRVCIVAPNSHHWVVADLAILSIGCVTVPVYPHLSNANIESIIRDSGAKLIFAEDDKILRRISSNHRVVMFKEGKSDNALFYEKLLCEEKTSLPEIFPEDIATIVYTSGTTGEPRGVVLTHRNISSEIDAVKSVYNFSAEKTGLLCIPLSHVLGRLLEFYQLSQGCRLAFNRGIDQLASDYLVLQPHFSCVVPRMLEKIYERVFEWRASQHIIIQKLIDFSLKIGREHFELLRGGSRSGARIYLENLLAQNLLFKKLRSRLGGNLEAIICGGATLDPEIAEFFHIVGLPVFEGYGLTETFAAVSVNRPDDFHLGSVGKPVEGAEIKIAPDHEILIKGPMVFSGYWNDGKFKRDSFDDEGWYHTGDLGSFMWNGFLKIEGRKKDVFVTAAGKNIVPSYLEVMLTRNRFIEQAFIYGDGRKYLVALITMNRSAVFDYLKKKYATTSILE
ncbi:MAG: long-chain fatty acid--CoA ligase, partial [Pseudomonadota bacterium]